MPKIANGPITCPSPVEVSDWSADIFEHSTTVDVTFGLHWGIQDCMQGMEKRDSSSCDGEDGDCGSVICEKSDGQCARLLSCWWLSKDGQLPAHRT